MLISQICTRSLVTCNRDTPAAELARKMRDQHVADVLVVEDHAGRLTPVGLVTDRDLVVEVIACDRDPNQVRAADLMCADLETVLDSELVYDAIWHMRKRQILRLPVVDAHGALVGMLTADDVAEFLASELTEVARLRKRNPALQAASSAYPTRR
jgi:signal-transduction protein with cAMP-binding, CBS, and nucleotidyltransferase domain